MVDSEFKISEFSNEFKFINVDNNKVPDRIKVVPTIIDSEYKDLLEGKKAFEYLYNKKYFNIPTNNLLLWKDKIIPKPEIKYTLVSGKAPYIFIRQSTFNIIFESILQQRNSPFNLTFLESKFQFSIFSSRNENLLLKSQG